MRIVSFRHQPGQITICVGDTRISLGGKNTAGFRPHHTRSRRERYIEIMRHWRKERLVIDETMKRAGCVGGRATTYWKAHRADDDSKALLVIKTQGSIRNGGRAVARSNGEGSVRQCSMLLVVVVVLLFVVVLTIPCPSIPPLHRVFPNLRYRKLLSGKKMEDPKSVFCHGRI